MLNATQSTLARALGITSALASRSQPVNNTDSDAEYIATITANQTSWDASERLEFIGRTVEFARAAATAHAQRTGAAS